MTNFELTTNPKGKESILQKAIYVWIDILGFSNILENESNYYELSELLKKYRDFFEKENIGTIHIISDGLLIVKETDGLKAGNVVQNVIDFFTKIGEIQLNFLVDIQFKYNLRGGFAIGSFLRPKENQTDIEFKKSNEFQLISNGLSKAYKLESSEVNWPIIGIKPDYLKEILDEFKIMNENEFFNLKKTYNNAGCDIYFIDYLRKVEPIFASVIEAEIVKNSPKCRSKYLWLYHYYCSNLNDVDFTHLNSKNIVL